MKKFLLTLLALVWVSAAAFAGEYTIQFVGNGTDKDNTSAFTSAKPIADIVDVGAEYLTSVKSVIRAYQGKDGYGLKFSSGSGNGSLVLSLSADGAKKITKIVATAASWTGTTGNVDESTLSINGSDAIAMDGGDLKEYTFNYTNVTEDATTLEINAVKRLYVQKLVVTYEEEQTGPTEYVTFPADIVSSNADANRYTSTLTLTVNGAAQTISNLQSSSDKHIYKDATAQSATFAPGDVVTIQSDFKGSWMHGYLWIDYNQDFQFTADVDANDIPTATSELVGYTNYNANPDGGGYWHNSAGTRLTGGGDGCANQPFTFTIPADLAPGDYRARFIVDYNFFDPTPDPDRSKNKIQENGGIIADFTIHVEAASATLYTVTIVEPEDGAIEVLADGATVVNSGDQVEAGTELTFTATPAEGYEFTGLYINDIVKNINNPFVVNEDVTILATFYNKYYNITYTTPENGTLAVTCDGVTVAPGDRLVHGSVLTITATPADGYELATLTVNGAALEGNTLTLTEDVAIAATFAEASQPGVEYTAPSGNSYPNNYLVGIGVTGTSSDFSQMLWSHPGIYSVFGTPIVASAGSDFTLNLTANSEGPSGTSGIEDMRYNIAYFFVDWYGTGTFSFLQAYGNHGATTNAPDDNVIGNYDDVMEIAHVFSVPADVADGTAARIRVIYQNAWTGLGQAAVNGGNPDPNATNLDKGIAYDFIVNVEGAGAPKYTVTFAAPENGTLTVLNGEAAINSGDQVDENTELTITATPADGYQLATLTANDAAIEGNTLTVTEDVTIAATFTEIPAVATRGSFTIPETSGSSTTELYSFRFDDAPLGSHTNGTIDDNDLRSRNFTYSAWLRIKSADGKPVMGNIQSDFSHACGAFLVTYSEGKLNFNGRNADANSSNFKDVQGSATTDEGTAIDEWVFVSVVADQANNTATLYKNGKAISSFATGYGIGLLADKGAFFIADNGASVEISEVQLWNKALTADELKDAYAFSYNANAVPENLVAYYRAGDFVEGSTTDLRNLGTEASAPGQMIKGRYYLQGGWNPQFLNQVAQDINVDGEGHVYKTVAVTAIQPEDEGNSFTITGAEGRAIENEANLYEKLTVVPALAEGVQLNGIKVVEGETETVYTLEQMPFYANADVTVSLDYTLPVVETRGSFTIPETTGNTNTQLYAFRFDDAPLGSHTNGTVDDNDLRSRNFTYSAWLRIKSADGKPIMGNIQTEFSHACGAFLVTYSDGKLNFNGRNADASSTNFKDMQGSATTDEGTAIDEWVFVSVVADQANNTVTLYKNGKAISSYATGYGIGLLPDAGSFFICDNGASVELSEVQLWNKALTADELKDAYAFSYNANAVPENLVAYYRAGDFVEGSTKALRNLGTEATTPAELLLGTYRVSGWSPYFSSPVAQDINVDGEGHVYKTVAVTAVQPEQEGCSFKITGNNGRAIETEANLYEKLTVVPTLAEGVQINGVKVVEGTTATTYTLDQMPFYANGDITVSLDFGTEVPNMYTVTFAAPENGTLEVLNGETVINSGDQVEENTVLTITATPAEGYQLATLTANDAAIEGNTLTVTEDVTIAATFAEAGQSYEIFDPTIRMSNGNRYTENITLMSEGQTQTISNLQANVSDYVYKDATDQVATFYAGKTVTATAGYNGSWMHGYLWIDYNKDYQFTPDMDANDIPTETSELVGFTGYNRDEAGRWHASDGTIFADGGGNANANQPISFTLPADLAPGDYRARFIVDWNAIEPNPDPNRSTNKIQANGGIIADFTIRIVEKNSFKVVANVTGGTASIEINGEGGFQDLPAEGMDVAKNAKVAVRFVPAASHYDLTSFEVNGVDETEDMSQRQNTIYSIASVDQDYTFNVAYTARKHTLTVINPQDVDPMQSWFGEFRDNNNEPLDMLTETTTEVEEGTSVFFVVMPPLEAAEEGEYELKTVTDNGADVTYELLPMDDGQYYMMGGITEDHTLIVTQSISGIIAISSDANNALKFENDILTIAAYDAVIEVADINGRVLRKAQTSAMEVSDLVKGVYVAKAVTADATYTLKFIKL